MKYQTETVYIVDYNDLNEATREFVKSKKLPGEPEVVSNLEMSNDTAKTISVSPRKPEGYDLRSFKKGDYSFGTNALLDWMCYDKIIPAGEYVIEISW